MKATELMKAVFCNVATEAAARLAEHGDAVRKSGKASRCFCRSCAADRRRLQGELLRPRFDGAKTITPRH